MTTKSLFKTWIGAENLNIYFHDEETDIQEHTTFKQYQKDDVDWNWGTYEVNLINLYPDKESVTVYVGNLVRSNRVNSFTVAEFINKINNSCDVNIGDMGIDTSKGAQNYKNEDVTIKDLQSGKTKYNWSNKVVLGWTFEDGILFITTNV